ncbi:MAG TPA: type IV toxin-antitoxin system AbiEi family antitoxin [Kofleriaceae bacterium]|nr:type IV toxin-antitoxin system AbiEi family antitoxin [Kofleriaceae bacterium]
MTANAILDAALGHLAELAFVRGVSRTGTRVELATDGGRFTLLVSTHAGVLGRMVAERTAHLLAEQAGADVPVIVAERIGAEVGRVIRDAGANYVDARGNLDLILGPGYVAHIEGRSGEISPARGRSLGLAGYRVLFTVLAQPTKVWPSIRALADAAGVSRQPAHDALQRLTQDACMARTSVGYHLLPERYGRVLDSWLGGYASVVRPKILLATLRRPETAPSELERALEGWDREWRFGGTAASFRLTGHYRGPTTIVHVRGPVAGLARELGARPDTAGNLVVLGIPGEAAMSAPRADVVHPLLIYSELMASADERARESARDLLEFVPASSGTEAM